MAYIKIGSSTFITDWKKFSKKTGIKVATGFFHSMVKNGVVSITKWNSPKKGILYEVDKYETFKMEKWLEKYISNHLIYEDGTIPTFKVHYYDKPCWEEDKTELRCKEYKIFDHKNFDLSRSAKNKCISYETPIKFQTVRKIIKGMASLFDCERCVVLNLNEVVGSSTSDLCCLDSVYSDSITLSKYLKENNLKFKDFPFLDPKADYSKVNEKYITFTSEAIRGRRKHLMDTDEFFTFFKENNLDFGCIPNIDVISSDETELNYKSADGTDMIKIDYVRKDPNKIGKRIWEYDPRSWFSSCTSFYDYFGRSWKVDDFENGCSVSHVDRGEAKDLAVCDINNFQNFYDIRLVVMTDEHKFLKVKSLISEVSDVCILGKKDPLLSEDNDYVDFFNKVKYEGPVGIPENCTELTNKLLEKIHRKYQIPVDLQTEDEVKAFKQRMDWYELPIKQAEYYDHDGLNDNYRCIGNSR